MDLYGLNNREIAITVWICIGLLVALFNKSIRKSLIAIAKLFFGRKIFTLYLLSVSYTCFGIYILYHFNAWTFGELKDTVLWCTVTIITTLFNLNKLKKDKKYFIEAIKENLKFTIIVEFITNSYAFSFIIELVMVPILLFLSAMLAFSETKKEFTAVRKIFYFLLIAYSCISIAHSIYEIKGHFDEFASTEKLKEFILSPFLAIWFLPWLLILSIYSRFEESFVMLKFSFPDSDLRFNAKRKAFSAFLLNPKGLERWGMRLNFYRPQTLADIDKSIANIKELQKTEKNPPPIAESEGWSPYKAKDFLKGFDIETQYYENVYEEEWAASSSYKKLDDSFVANSITYSVIGNKKVAKELELCLRINQPENEDVALAYFKSISEHLFFCATTNKKLPESVSKNLLKKRNFLLSIDAIKICLKRDDYKNALNHYSLSFNIKYE